MRHATASPLEHCRESVVLCALSICTLHSLAGEFQTAGGHLPEARYRDTGLCDRGCLYMLAFQTALACALGSLLLSIARSFSLARASRDITVPAGQPRTVAIS